MRDQSHIGGKHGGVVPLDQGAKERKSLIKALREMGAVARDLRSEIFGFRAGEKLIEAELGRWRRAPAHAAASVWATGLYL
jgi:hypothetical protein